MKDKNQTYLNKLHFQLNFSTEIISTEQQVKQISISNSVLYDLLEQILIRKAYKPNYSEK